MSLCVCILEAHRSAVFFSGRIFILVLYQGSGGGHKIFSLPSSRRGCGLGVPALVNVWQNSRRTHLVLQFFDCSDFFYNIFYFIDVFSNIVYLLFSSVYFVFHFLCFVVVVFEGKPRPLV